MMDAVGIFLQLPRKSAPLPDTVIRPLCVRARQGSVSAREQLLRAHLGLAVHVAKSFYRPGSFCDLGDLIQQGCLGLLRAIDKYNPRKVSHGKPVRFATYAHFWVSHYIRREIENNGRTIAVPIDRIRAYLRNEVEPKIPAPGRPARKWAVYAAMQPMVPLHGDMGDAYESLVDHPDLTDPRDSPENWLHSLEVQGQVRLCLSMLPKRPREILRHRYGLAGGPGLLTQKQVGKRLGLSVSAVGYLERAAIEMLAAKMSI